MRGVVLRNHGHGMALVLTSPSASLQSAQHQNSIHPSKLTSDGFFAISQQKLTPLPLLHLACMFLTALSCLTWYYSCVRVLYPSTKEKITQKFNFVSLIPQKPSGPGALPCAEQVKKYFRRMGGWGRKPFKRVLTPHKMHYRALSESPCYISQPNYEEEGLTFRK